MDAKDDAPAPDALIAILESFTKAYPEDMFGPVTDEERKQHGSLITRNSAAMGRHCAKFMGEAAAALAAQARELERLQESLDNSHRDFIAILAERNQALDQCAELHGRLAAQARELEQARANALEEAAKAFEARPRESLLTYWHAAAAIRALREQKPTARTSTSE